MLPDPNMAKKKFNISSTLKKNSKTEEVKLAPKIPLKKTKNVECRETFALEVEKEQEVPLHDQGNNNNKIIIFHLQFWRDKTGLIG